MTDLRITCAGRTATGKVRQNNEDALWLGRLHDEEARAGDRRASGGVGWPGFLLAVADGMGGALAGEVASRLAVENLARELSEATRAGPPPDLVATGKAAVERVNERIREEGDRDPARRGMGTTLTAAWLLDDAAQLFQVGDSRAYLMRGGSLEQLTKDQSLVGKLVEDGILSEEEAERVAGRHIILQALGTEEALDVEHRRVGLERGDLLLLCTDGLTGLVKHAAIEAELRRGGDLPAQVDRLVAMAEAEGGIDNVTVILARVA